MVTVSISETYDLHTVVNKMTLIAIHTPNKALIQKAYPGLCMNYKYFRIKSVDVALSTAQTLPLGVDQIGLDEGKIRPQDMMNPILYKAVSNDSWSTLEARLNGLYFNGIRDLEGSMADVESSQVTGLPGEHGVYYALLSNRDGFRIAHPQSGLQMKGLRPIVFTQLANHAVHGNSPAIGAEYAPDIAETSSADSTPSLKNAYIQVMRGRPVPMPRMNTTFLTGISPGWSGSTMQSKLNGMGDGTPANLQTQMPTIPPVMLGAIIIPPATATAGILYYRMVTRVWIEFTEVRPITEVTSFSEMNSLASVVYHSDYEEQSKKMDATTDMVDIKNGEIEKIMEGR